MDHTRLSLSTELEEEREEVRPFRVGWRGAELEMPPSRCPVDRPYVVRGFNQFSDDVRLLPADQQKKLAEISLKISKLASSLPEEPLDPARRENQILVVGHADLDAARESREPGFLQSISEKRAASVRSYLCSVLGFEFWQRIWWNEIGLGARALAVRNPRNETERKCNRRVEIVLNPRPVLNEPQRRKVQSEFEGPGSFTEYYAIALQGTSGQFREPRLAERKAREIAERVGPFINRRNQEVNDSCGKFFPTFVPHFKSALQGTASKHSDPDVVINKASEIAERAYFGANMGDRKLQWKYAPLPQPMAADCEIGGRVRGGPPNHVVCRQHDHILDTTTFMVIASDLDDYKKRFPGRPPGQRARAI